MKIGFVWGVLPYIQTQSHDGWGHTKGLWVQLSSASQEQLAHELFHVKQFYASFMPVFAGIAMAILVPHWAVQLSVLVVCAVELSHWFTQHGKLSREAAAYGESLRHTPPDRVAAELERFSTALSSDHYGLKYSRSLIRDMILASYRSKRLFA